MGLDSTSSLDVSSRSKVPWDVNNPLWTDGRGPQEKFSKTDFLERTSWWSALRALAKAACLCTRSCGEKCVFQVLLSGVPTEQCVLRTKFKKRIFWVLFQTHTTNSEKPFLLCVAYQNILLDMVLALVLRSIGIMLWVKKQHCFLCCWPFLLFQTLGLTVVSLCQFWLLWRLALGNQKINSRVHLQYLLGLNLDPYWARRLVLWKGQIMKLSLRSYEFLTKAVRKQALASEWTLAQGFTRLAVVVLEFHLGKMHAGIVGTNCIFVAAPNAKLEEIYIQGWWTK